MDEYTSTSLTAWLGDAADDLTPEQRTHLEALIDAYQRTIIERRPGYGTDDYDERDYFDETEAAWIAALDRVRDEFDLAARGRTYLSARTHAQQGAIIAVLDGVSEAEAARDAVVSRPTLRKMLGK